MDKREEASRRREEARRRRNIVMLQANAEARPEWNWLVVPPGQAETWRQVVAEAGVDFQVREDPIAAERRKVLFSQHGPGEEMSSPDLQRCVERLEAVQAEIGLLQAEIGLIQEEISAFARKMNESEK
jgi:hypothetical protein